GEGEGGGGGGGGRRESPSATVERKGWLIPAPAPWAIRPAARASAGLWRRPETAAPPSRGISIGLASAACMPGSYAKTCDLRATIRRTLAYEPALGGPMLADTFVHDLRVGYRVLLKDKSFCAMAIAVLALGICGVTTTFSVVNGVMLRGFSFPNASRLVSVNFEDPTSRTFFGANGQIA